MFGFKTVCDVTLVFPEHRQRIKFDVEHGTTTLAAQNQLLDLCSSPMGLLRNQFSVVFKDGNDNILDINDATPLSDLTCGVTLEVCAHEAMAFRHNTFACHGGS